MKRAEPERIKVERNTGISEHDETSTNITLKSKNLLSKDQEQAFTQEVCINCYMGAIFLFSFLLIRVRSKLIDLILKVICILNALALQNW